MYGSSSAEEIFQRHPLLSKPSQFRPKSWTETIEGYLHEAKKLSVCILKNRKLLGRPYSWFVTLYVWDVMTPKEAAALWSKASRNMRRHGITALWIREPTKKNKIHYHMLVSSQQSEKDLAEVIEASMPSRKVVGWHKSIDAINERWWWLAFYITKARVKGEYQGRLVPDKYLTKRLLFKPHTKLRKHGTIGPFWLKTIKAIWQEVKDQERKIAEGLADHRVRRLAKHVHELIGGYYPLKTIQRSFGLHSQSPAVQDWIAALERQRGDQWAEFLSPAGVKSHVR